jgi:saccharopine dehydrogenase-like NADP-dependent oxidoreductase
LIDLKGQEKRELLISLEEIKKLKFYQKIKYHYKNIQQLSQTAKVMPNGEIREVKSLKKKKTKRI